MFGSPGNHNSSMERTLPPKVEIFVESLNGIMWSTSTASSSEELEKKVPFVTAAVEFSGTCPNMKVYSATKMPFTKQPAVESYFATLAPNQHELATDTLVMPPRKVSDVNTPRGDVIKEGVYPLSLNWHKETVDEKLVDSIAFFTSTMDSAEDGSGKVGIKEARKPHLSFTLPAPEKPQIPGLAMMYQCQSGEHPGLKQAEEFIKSNLKGPKKHGKYGDEGASTKTHSTAASTTGLSFISASNQDMLRNKKSLIDLECLLHEDEENHVHTADDEQEVTQVIASKENKEKAAEKLAGDPFSRFVGAGDESFTPSWMSCGKGAPEILELRVRVLPEDYDEYDEMDPESQQITSPEELEGITHLVFLNEIIEEGTTVIDLPLRISPEAQNLASRDRSGLSTMPTLGNHDTVFLSSDATLRIRMTITAQRETPVPSMIKSSSFISSTFPKKDLPSFAANLQQVKPMIEKLLQTKDCSAANDLLAKINKSSEQSEISLDADEATTSGDLMDRFCRYSKKLNLEKAMAAMALAIIPNYSELEMRGNDRDQTIPDMPGSSSTMTESLQSMTSSIPIKEIQIDSVL